MARHHVGAAPAKWSNYYQHSFAQTFLKPKLQDYTPVPKDFSGKNKNSIFPCTKPNPKCVGKAD